MRGYKWEIAKAAIDYVVKETKKNNSQSITLGFHGGGEPTLNWNILTKAVRYVKNEAHKNSKALHITGSFNGYWTGHNLDFITSNFTEISMSFDGIPIVQNRHRPTKDNTESFSTVTRSLYTFDEKQFNYGIRLTVTEESVNYLEECVSFICERFNPQKIQVEPVFLEGRAIKNVSQIRNLDVFITQFIKSHEIAERHGITLFYSGARIEVLTQRFCLASCRAFVVTPEGDVTTCFETYGRDHPMSERFMVGRYDGNAGFIVDNEKLNKHFSRVVDNIPYCESCYCRWHCAGDCAIKTLSPIETENFVPTERCYINRELTKYLILCKIRKSNELIWMTDKGGNR
ncbi:radical SAM protein [Candidatus Magnetobacterium casense]|uniref:SPASM domain-containing protein n=1 Tax=Candidatus Magnetobacterium casense TaxID=1455061 RepID=A0ABS6RX97_9BACT|nr:SPASM domain-containing protein [Candidatus Magnetobacterium casensis]MBV6341241.1 SPASM domain-containing protein [Candidatus Magnetobacterium casensis]